MNKKMNNSLSKIHASFNGSRTTTATNTVIPRSEASKNNGGIEPSQLMKLFEDELKDIYWVEKALLMAIPKMIRNATSEVLIDALNSHLSETENQVKRVERVFEVLGKPASANKCEAMEGLMREAELKMKVCEVGAMCDAAIIASAQKVEHYEIASYGTLHQFAVTLGMFVAADLLMETLSEEYGADKLLSEVAVDAVNIRVS